jgi:hypothetical protein
MKTECTQEPFGFHPLNQREIRGQFDGGAITSDAGGLLLREVEKRTKIIGQFASCFTAYRDPELVEHGVAELLGQRIYGHTRVLRAGRQTTSPYQPMIPPRLPSP